MPNAVEVKAEDVKAEEAAVLALLRKFAPKARRLDRRKRATSKPQARGRRATGPGLATRTAL